MNALLLDKYISNAGIRNLSFNVCPALTFFCYWALLTHTIKRVSMGLTDRRKTAKNLADSRKN